MMRRFTNLPKAKPDKVRKLNAAHSAIVNGHALFKAMVVNAADTPRLLVSGMNNRKIGSTVTIGPWDGMAIYMLTLEERATCPRTCSMWRDCYGNAMHRARRHRHGSDLEARLQREIAILARENPRGFVVRLHILGDFYSVGYASLWIDMLDLHPELHVFGYTARSMEHDLPIAALIKAMNTAFPDRCVIRWSQATPRPGGAAVVASDAPIAGAFVCPAETGKTDCCGTCGLCWAEATKDKAVLFLRHGMMGAGRMRKVAA